MTSQQAGTSPQTANRTIGPGAILVQSTTILPEPLRLETDSNGCGWARVANTLDGSQLEKRLRAVGWTLFYMAGAITTTVFGFEKHSMIRAALNRLIAKARLQKCNCLEIDDIATHSFLGMQYVNVSAHSRHIQKGVVFSGA